MTTLPCAICKLFVFMALIIGNTNGTSNEIPPEEVKQEPSKPPIKDENADLNVQTVTNLTTTSTSDNTTDDNNPRTDMIEEKVLPSSASSSQSQPNAVNQFAQRLNPKIFNRPNIFQNANPSSNTSTTTTSVNKPGKPNKPGTSSAPSKIPTIMWSPVSVFNALTPLLFAASGKTQLELQSILVPKTPGKTNNVTSSSSSSSSNYTYSFSEELPKNSREFSSATGLFSRVDSPLNAEYLLDVQRNMGNVDVKEVDFANVSIAVKNINSWVQERTDGMIGEVVDEGQVDPATFLVLVNCVRFKANWIAPFNENLTKISNFTGSNGVQKVRMMHQRSTQHFAKFPISRDEEQPVAPFKVLELPYEDGLFSSIFILPNSTEDLLSTMEYVEETGIENIRKMLGPVEVDISMPKFQINSDVNVEDALVESGLTTLFNPGQANLTRLLPPLIHHDDDDDGEKELTENSTSSIQNQTLNNKFIPAPYLSKIVHRTIFEISEEGTKAGAVTAISIVPLSALSDYRVMKFTLDRPFMIYLVKNNTIIFQGVIASLPELEEQLTPPAPAKIIDTASRDALVTSNKTMEALVTERDGDKHDEHAWWVPPAVPAYLKNETTTAVSDSSKTKESEASASSETVHSPSPSSTSNAEDVPDSSAPAGVGLDSETLITEPSAISFSKYQQPEPIDPNGIRFPATAPKLRNHLIKPRLNDNVKIKTSLLHWMNVY